MGRQEIWVGMVSVLRKEDPSDAEVLMERFQRDEEERDFTIFRLWRLRSDFDD